MLKNQNKPAKVNPEKSIRCNECRQTLVDSKNYKRHIFTSQHQSKMIEDPRLCLSSLYFLIDLTSDVSITEKSSNKCPLSGCGKLHFNTDNQFLKHIKEPKHLKEIAQSKNKITIENILSFLKKILKKEDQIIEPQIEFEFNSNLFLEFMSHFIWNTSKAIPSLKIDDDEFTIIIKQHSNRRFL